MKRILIIGIGSPFRGDQIGWDVVEAIEEDDICGRYPFGIVETFRCASPAGLLQLLSEADAAILIDATRSGAAPGSVRRIDVGDLRTETEKFSTHGWSVAESLALGQVLELLPATLILYGVEVGDAGHIEADSVLPDLLREVADDLGKLLVNHGDYGEKRRSTACEGLR